MSGKSYLPQEAAGLQEELVNSCFFNTVQRFAFALNITT